MLLSVSNIRKTILYCKRNGFKNTVYATMERVEEKRRKKYQYLEPSEAELEAQRNDKLQDGPLISIVVPCYETKPVFLEDLILSIEEQSYQNFQLILADASKTSIVKKTYKVLNSEYENIEYYHLKENKGISENTNQGLTFAKGQYVALLDHDDVLTKDALYHVAKAIMNFNESEGPVLVYTDEDKANTYLDTFYEANYKTKLNEDLIMTNNYICHLSVYRADVIKELGLRAIYDGAQDFDLVLRTMGLAKKKYGSNWKKFFIHIPKVLYHWRCHEESTASNPASKDYAYENGRKAVEEYVRSCGYKASVSHLKHVGFYKVNYKDIFESRQEVGAVGGPLYEKNRITGGAMNLKGQVLYNNLRRGYSGYLHRASLVQDVGALDIRNIVLRKELEPVFYEETGLRYPVNNSILSVNTPPR